MLMNIAAYVCFAIVLGVMIAIKIYFSHEEKPSTEKSDISHSVRGNRNSGNKTSFTKGGPKK